MGLGGLRWRIMQVEKVWSPHLMWRRLGLGGSLMKPRGRVPSMVRQSIFITSLSAGVCSNCFPATWARLR